MTALKYFYSLDQIAYHGGFQEDKEGFSKRQDAVDFVIDVKETSDPFWVAKIDRTRVPHRVTDISAHCK